nr:DUF357 domain-containing protein [uncultured Methanoregula sp.]
MKSAECQAVLADTLALCHCPCTGDSPLGEIGAAIHLMARSYESDGRGFFASGDLVNALASYWYASGWLHFGIAYGILSCRDRTIPCIFDGPDDQMPDRLKEKLSEKTARYARLLDTARSSVIPAPDASAPGHAFALRVLCISGTYADYGDRSRKNGTQERALASLSYGHGWLDAAVTAGLFSIVSNRDIFTV